MPLKSTLHLCTLGPSGGGDLAAFPCPGQQDVSLLRRPLARDLAGGRATHS